MHWKTLTSFRWMACVVAGAALLSAQIAYAGSPISGHNESQSALKSRLMASFKERTKDSCKPTAPIETELRFTSAPEPGKPTTLQFSVLPQEEGPNAEIRFDVPKGISVRQGAMRQAGNLVKDQAVQFPLLVSVDQPGDYVIAASAIMGPEHARFGRRQELYIHATRDGIQVSDTRTFTEAEKSPTGVALRMPANEVVTPDPDLKDRPTPKAQLPEGVTTDPNQGDTATSTVYGYFRYRHPDGTVHNAYGTQADAWDQDDFSGADYLGSSVCDWNGYFEISFDNNTDGFLEPGTADVYLEFRTTNGVVRVRDNNANIFTAGTGVIFPNIGAGSHNAGSWYVDWGTAGVSDNAERAYQIQVTMTQSWAWSYYDVGFNPHYTYCQWFVGSTDGTYYRTSEDMIHLSYNDHNSPAVIAHEYGHSHMDSVYGENYIPNSGGSHWFTNHYNTALAMSEGYATYVSCSARNDKWYDDNNPGNLIHFDCELNYDGYGAANGNVDGLGYGYDTESAVLAFLIDLEDTSNSPTDPFDWTSGNRGVIFDVMRNYLPGGHHPYSIQEFYDGWYARGWGARPQLNGQMQVHGMEQGIGRPTLGIYGGLSRYGGTWYWNGYGRGSFDVKNYGSRPYAHNGFYVWLRYPNGNDAFGLTYVGGTSPIASGATQNVWSAQDHIANSSRVLGNYTLTAGHWRSDNVWQVLDAAESGTTNQITVPVVADTDAPDFCNVVDDGAVQNNSTSLHFVATANDYDSAIAGYWTRVGTAAGAGDEQDWVWHANYNVTNWNYTITGLSMAANVKYYITVVARNVEGYDKYGYSDGIIAWDATPPGAVTVTDDGAFTYDLSQLHFVAKTSEPDGEIAGYWVQIGTTSGGNDVKTWEFFPSSATTFDKSITGLTLVDGTTYYITVVARNKSNLDTWGFSDGITAKIDKTVKGKITLNDWIPGNYWVLLVVRNPGSLGYVEYHWVFPDASGNYSFGTGLTGTYDITAWSYHWLQQRRASVSFAGTTISNVNFSLTNGDVDGDNAVTVFDYNRLSDAFDSVPGDSNWDWYADLDGDEAVTVFDYNILSANFDQVGDD